MSSCNGPALQISQTDTQYIDKFLNKNPSIPTPFPSATMLGTQIKPVTVAKDLGVYIDCHLNFNEHIIKTASDSLYV